MFTGIIDHAGIIAFIVDLKQGKRFVIKTQFNDLTTGESIAMDGACLTVTDIQQGSFACDVSPETLQLTVFSALHVGDKINLERSLRLHDRISGHFVSGHIDQTMEIKSKNKYQDFIEYEFAGVLSEFKKYLMYKGSITVNGVSLTVNILLDDGFKVMMIPETLVKTNLSQLMVGDLVNIEFDLLIKSVARQIELIKLEEI